MQHATFMARLVGSRRSVVEGIEFNEGEQLLSPMCPPNRGQHRYPASRERADGRVPPRVAVLSSYALRSRKAKAGQLITMFVSAEPCGRPPGAVITPRLASRFTVSASVLSPFRPWATAASL